MERSDIMPMNIVLAIFWIDLEDSVHQCHIFFIELYSS